MKGMAMRFMEQYKPEEPGLSDSDLALTLVAKLGGTVEDALRFIASQREINRAVSQQIDSWWTF